MPFKNPDFRLREEKEPPQLSIEGFLEEQSRIIAFKPISENLKRLFSDNNKVSELQKKLGVLHYNIYVTALEFSLNMSSSFTNEQKQDVDRLLFNYCAYLDGNGNLPKLPSDIKNWWLFPYCELSESDLQSEPSYNRDLANNSKSILQKSMGWIGRLLEKLFFSNEIIELRPAAKQGDAEAQYNLSVCYENGDGVCQDCKKAMYLLQMAAEQGNADAQGALGCKFLKGNEGVPKDINKAKHWLQQAGENGKSEAYTLLGCLYADENNTEENEKKAIFWWRKAAEQGNSAAQYMIASQHLLNEKIGLSADLKEAMHWLKKAAEQGNRDAQYELGNCYEQGIGSPEKLGEAINWYYKAAEQGNTDAQLSLGHCYKNGKGVDIDLEEAIKWYRKAAEQGNAKAQCVLGALYEKGDGVHLNLENAISWYRKAAEQGYANAQFKLGLCYKDGKGVPADIFKSQMWLKKAAAQHHYFAQQVLNGNETPWKFGRH